MALYANFDTETGECLYCGDAPGTVKLPTALKGQFPKRYLLKDGKVIDKYPGMTDQEAEQTWLAEVYVEPTQS